MTPIDVINYDCLITFSNKTDQQFCLIYQDMSNALNNISFYLFLMIVFSVIYLILKFIFGIIKNYALEW